MGSCCWANTNAVLDLLFTQDRARSLINKQSGKFLTTGNRGTLYLFFIKLGDTNNDCNWANKRKMARIARVVAPGIPHHVTQRGNSRQQTFFNEDDYRFYQALMSEWCKTHDVEIWVYCLMPNHIHLIAVPKNSDSLRLSIGEAHRRYTRRINFREGWRGHLWQGRFSSFIMDEKYLLACTRYIELNPVRAGLVKNPENWLLPWSSASAHLKGENDMLVNASPLLFMVKKQWSDFLLNSPCPFGKIA